MILRFKNRIALFNTLAVALTSAFVFVVIYLVVDKTAYNHLDEDILQEKEEVISSLFWKGDSIIINKMPEWDEAEHDNVEVSPTFLQILDNNGKVIFHSANLLKEQFPYNPGNKQEFFFNGEINGQRIRLGQFSVNNDSDKIIGQLTIAVSQEESYVILDNLLLVLLISFPLVLIIQFLTSSFAASKSIEPVHQLIKTASGIGSANMSTRLVLPGYKDELYELTNTINELLSRIEASLVQQKQFTSDASHEIRTPLAAIRGTLEVLIRKPREQIVYENKITEIITQVDRIDTLLDQLLQLARIESGFDQAKQENVNLTQLVSVLSNKWEEALITGIINLHIQIPEDVTVTADIFYIELILNNLVSNAIKYGKENGNVYLKWDHTTKTLSVKDDGPGIPATHLPNIFDRFYRVDESRSSAIKGSGLGLSIVKKLAEIQHITLRIESIEGIGSTFTLQFPV
jgi:two-component system, OmpR family, heavy metal sensor histidine kinase CusS